MTRPAPAPRMRIVPEVADTAMQHAGADAIDWQDKDKSPQKIFRLGWPAMLDAAPSAGRVSREMVERVARGMCRRAFLHSRRFDPQPPTEAYIAAQSDLYWRHRVRDAEAAIHDLGLTVAPAADTARNGEAE